MINKRSFTLPTISITLAVAMAGCKSSPTPVPTPIVTARAPSSGLTSSRGTVAASGKVVPVQTADLGFAVSGRVQTVAVVRGDEVQPGDVLVTLERDLLEASVRQAEAALGVARAELALAEAGPRPEEIAIAEAQLQAAEGALAQAAAQRNRPDLGATKAEITAAQAQVAGAMADRLLADQTHEQTMKCVNIQLDGEKKKICPALGPIEEQARYVMHAAGAAQGAAQAQLDALLASGDAEVRAAQAGVWTASAQRDAAEAELDTLTAGVTPGDIALAQAAVRQAEATLQAARATLDRATLRAPFAGAVTAVEVSPGETVVPGHAVIALADLHHLQAQTTDLSERDVARVTVGQRASVYVEALGAEAEGRVVCIASQADTVGGDVVYAVDIALDDGPPALRWGMSVEVEIAAQ